jgi:hypothetical protein
MRVSLCAAASLGLSMLEGALIWGLATRGKGSGATTDIAIVGADIVVRRKIFSVEMKQISN